MHVYRFTDIGVSVLQVWKYMYKRIKVYKCAVMQNAGMRISKCLGMPLCMYASIQIEKKVSMND